jgi:23S rRNA (adenine2503-C2)-methyltransferase
MAMDALETTGSGEAGAAGQRVNLFGLPRAGLEALCAALGSKPYRARQLMNWLYKRGCDRF